jgi:hypothetical protein
LEPQPHQTTVRQWFPGHLESQPHQGPRSENLRGMEAVLAAWREHMYLSVPGSPIRLCVAVDP